MKLRYGTLRKLLREAIHFDPLGEERWQLTSHPVSLSHADSPVLNFKPDGYIKDGTFAVAQVAVSFPKAYLDDRKAPRGVTPTDVLETLKTGEAQHVKGGAVLVPEPGLQIKVADEILGRLRTMPAVGKMRPDYVTCPESSSELSTMFARRVARQLGAKFITFGLLKQRDPMKLSVDEPSTYTPAQLKKLHYNLGRARGEMGRRGGFSMRSNFHGRERHLVRNFLEPSDEMLGIVTEPGLNKKPTVLLIDDIVTTNSTLAEAARILNEIGFEVVGSLVMFKEPEKR